MALHGKDADITSVSGLSWSSERETWSWSTNKTIHQQATYFINHDWSEVLPFLNISKYDDLWFKVVLLSLKLLQLAPSRNSLPPSASVLSWCWGKVSSVQSCWHFGWKKGGWWKADRHAVLSYIWIWPLLVAAPGSLLETRAREIMFAMPMWLFDCKDRSKPCMCSQQMMCLTLVFRLKVAKDHHSPGADLDIGHMPLCIHGIRATRFKFDAFVSLRGFLSEADLHRLQMVPCEVVRGLNSARDSLTWLC